MARTYNTQWEVLQCFYLKILASTMFLVTWSVAAAVIGSEEGLRVVDKHISK